MMPSDVDYFVWNAIGNEATCDAQGFLAVLGGYGGLFYNISLNLFYLAVIRYEKSDKFIRDKIEPFLHGVPIVMALGYGITRLVMKHYNASRRGICNQPVHYPAHSVGYDVGEVRDGFDIVCGRGVKGERFTYYSRITFVFVPAIIILISLGIIYRTVSKQEKKLEKYGVGALRINIIQQSENMNSHSDAQRSSIWGRIRTSLHSKTSSLRLSKWSSKTKMSMRSNSTGSQSRAVMHKAFGYSFAWLLSWGFAVISWLILLSGNRLPLALSYMTTIFVPLQGFFNLLTFMFPKIMSAKRSKRENLSWYQALSRAFWSRGIGGKKQGSRTSNLRSKGQRKTMNNTNKKNSLVCEAKKQRSCVSAEEEKTEIEMPSNLSSHKKTSYSTYAPNISYSVEKNIIDGGNNIQKNEIVMGGDDKKDTGNSKMSGQDGERGETFEENTINVDKAANNGQKKHEDENKKEDGPERGELQFSGKEN